MILEDLEYIFEPQVLEDTTDELYFMVCDGDTNTILRHPKNEIDDLIPMLSSFEYIGTRGLIPRFSK